MLQQAVISSLKTLFERDLRKLESEIAAFKAEEDLWVIGGDIRNPAGNLALHLCGNLRYYIGNVLGNSGYVRNRDEEFSAKHVPKQTLIDHIHNTLQQVADALPKLSESQLEEEYPIQVFDHKMTTIHFLIHLHGHLNYHLGQVNYLRRFSAH